MNYMSESKMKPRLRAEKLVIEYRLCSSSHRFSETYSDLFIYIFIFILPKSIRQYNNICEKNDKVMHELVWNRKP